MPSSPSSVRRPRFLPAVLVASLLAAGGCRAPGPVPAVTAPPPVPATALLASTPMDTDTRNWPDLHSHAEPDAWVTRHYDLDLRVDFEAQRLHGRATLEVERRDARARDLVLDTRDLEVRAVAAAPAGSEAFAPARYSLGERHAVLGSPLRIAMPAGAARVRIDYATSPQASGLQWLEPAQTAGRSKPFVYSQAQSLHARSFVPLQDTPRLRISAFGSTSRPRKFLNATSGGTELPTLKIVSTSFFDVAGSKKLLASTNASAASAVSVSAHR